MGGGMPMSPNPMMGLGASPSLSMNQVCIEYFPTYAKAFSLNYELYIKKTFRVCLGHSISSFALHNFFSSLIYMQFSEDCACFIYYLYKQISRFDI